MNTKYLMTKMTLSAHLKTVLAGAFVILALSGCEDEPPTNYVPKPYIEAYLIVGEPIRDITVAITQPIEDSYEFGEGMVNNAIVKIRTGNEVYDLQYREIGGIGQYFYPDSSVRIQPQTKYDLEVQMPGGALITATTTTPEAISWTVPPKDVIQYTRDTVNLPIVDSLAISWSRGNAREYLIRVRVLDTLGYGQYLQPPREESNERTNNLSNFERVESRTFYSFVRWGFVQINQVPTVWTAFKWYGRNEVAIFAPDKAMLDWFKATKFTGSPRFNDYYMNINNGVGVFGSASMITHEVFMLKWKE